MKSFLDKSIPLWLSKCLFKRGYTGRYFYYLKYPRWKTFYNDNGNLIWIGGFDPLPNFLSAITWRMLLKCPFIKPTYK